MHKILYIFIMMSCLNAQVQTQPKATELEMFLFKIGFTSLVEDVNNEKYTTKLNSEDIKELKINVKHILEILNKKQLEKISSNNIAINNDNSYLEQEIAQLKEEIKLLKNKQSKPKEVKAKKIIIKKIVKENKILNATVIQDAIYIRKTPTPTGKIVRTVYKGNTLSIDYCNKYGWCKLKNKWEFIAKWKLEFIN